MRANLDAAGGFPLAEHVAALLAPALGRAPRTTWWPRPAQRGARRRAARCATACWLGRTRPRLAAAGITPEQVEQALDPAGYLGAAGGFVAAALAAHTSTEQNGRP